jgi:hypothetical protein
MGLAGGGHGALGNGVGAEPRTPTPDTHQYSRGVPARVKPWCYMTDTELSVLDCLEEVRGLIFWGGGDAWWVWGVGWGGIDTETPKTPHNNIP